MQFSFGKNWTSFLKNYYSQERLEEAKKSIQKFLGLTSLENYTVMDIGCGSGLFSLATYTMGAREIFSFDIDPFSVHCCNYLKGHEGNPETWKILHGSVLDKNFLNSLPQADLVYSWGVLHHTGDVWTAIQNAASKVKPNGLFFIAIYNKINGPLGSNTWLHIKRWYNAMPRPIQLLLEGGYMVADMLYTLVHGKNPYLKIKNYKSHRGMNWYTDIKDWLGGYPYEYATANEMIDFCKNRLGFIPLKVVRRESLACNEFLFRKPA